jgi:arylsulfatase A-like enzyme
MIRLCITFLFASIAAMAAERPNIVVFLADDLGFSDLGCYGGEIKTPNLDRMAAEGLRFTNFYNCALCGPSRAALMTGLHPHQTGISNWTGLLNERCVTAFELLKGAGYATCAVGRLDMTTSRVWHEPPNLSRVLDRYLGSTGHQGPGNYFADVRLNASYRDGEPFSIPKGGYKTDYITDFAVEFIREQKKERPFFIYLAHYAPHWPLHAKEADIAKYRALYRRLGWERARSDRHQRTLALGLIPPGTRLAMADPRVKPWAASPNQDWEAERMAVFAAQVDCLDQNVGRVMDALKETGADRDTLVFFLSDNGASDTGGGGVLDKKDQTWRVDGTPTRSGNRPDIWPGPADTFVTAGPAWSNVSNAPFRNHKRSAYEGGIASPLIVRWPAEIDKGGGLSAELSHITDVTATILDAAGATYPPEYDGRKIAPIEGRSLLPLLRDGKREGHPHLCWSISGHRAVREGDWKLVAAPDKAWELFDLSRDRAELDDVTASHPEIVARLAKLHEEFSKR